MELSSIPVEVIDGNVLPYLEWNDLLRFRRVCRATKDITDGFLKVHPELAPEIEINEDDKSFGEFVKMDIPTTKVFLNNGVAGIEFFLNSGSDGVEFLERFGAHVKDVRVAQLYQIMFGKERDFLEAFVNLESLQVGSFLGYRNLENLYNEAPRDQRYHPWGGQFPSVFQRLRELRFGGESQSDVAVDRVAFNCGILQASKNLKVAAVPFYACSVSDAESLQVYLQYTSENQVAVAFVMIEGMIRERGLRGISNLEIYDCASFHSSKEESRQGDMDRSGHFLKLCTTFLKYDVKLMNVAAYWFYGRSRIPEFSSPDLGKPVLSLVNLHPCVLPLNMPNLERIDIRGTLRSSPGVNWRQEHQRPDWPSLKILEIYVNSTSGGVLEWEDNEQLILFNHITSTKNLFKLFFEDVSREALTELHLKFAKDVGSVAVPKVEDIVSSCPNLKHLTLSNWPGTNKALTELWKGLPGLVEISLEHCKDLGNVAFVGEDTRSPVFLKLKKLRKLTLKGLDEMPKITDTLFSRVIRHLKLAHFTLTSGDPVKSVTADGIRSLRCGNFAESIEKFSFQNWSLADVSTEEFKQHEKEFRSYYML